MRFWDTSAIVPLLIREPGTDALLELAGEPKPVFIWWGTSVEVHSALSRRERTGVLSSAAYAGAVSAFLGVTSGWREVSPGEALRATAERLLRVHPIRAADALQLAAAAYLAADQGISVDFVCLDERLRNAAAREGMNVLPAQTNWNQA